MKFAYADPPYLGYASFYAELHPEAMSWDDPETHRALISRLCADYPDGWALSLTSGNLKDILPMCPTDVRVGAWVKPFCSFKKHVPPAYAWEPVIFRGGRKHDVENETVRDWIPANITLQKGLTGAKPREFCLWIFALMKAQRGDQFDDIFPGTEILGEAWKEYAREPIEQLGMFANVV